MATINAAGLALIEQFEGCELTAYDDGTGVLTIGYGHTDGVSAGETISMTQAIAFLHADLASAEADVSRLVEIQLRPNQFSALVSFQFNTGALGGSTLLALLNQGDTAGAAGQFARWDQAGGAVLEGLQRRRAAERALFLTP
jgi:lysozyme